MMIDGKVLYTPAQIAGFLGTTPNNVRQHIRAHELEADLIIGRMTFFGLETVAFIRGRQGKVGKPGHKIEGEK